MQNFAKVDFYIKQIITHVKEKIFLRIKQELHSSFLFNKNTLAWQKSSLKACSNDTNLFKQMPENECAEFLSMEYDFGHLSGLLLQAGNHMERYRGRHCSKCSLKTIASVSKNDVSLSVSFKKAPVVLNRSVHATQS